MSQSKFYRKDSSLQARDTAFADTEDFSNNNILTLGKSRNGGSNETHHHVPKMNRKIISSNLKISLKRVSSRPVIFQNKINWDGLDFADRELSAINVSPLERFGTQIRLRRKMAGSNIIQFADKCSLDLETLAAIELGLAPPETVCLHLTRLAEGLTLSSNVLKKFLRYLYTHPPV